jgi:hypothetical protein
MTNKILAFSFLIIVSLSASGQTFLVLEKMGTKKRFEFYPGQQMEVKLKNDNYFTRINILGLGDSLISTENQDIKFSSITAVQIKEKSGFLRYSGPILMVAGAVLFAIDALNQTVVQGGEYVFSPGVATASASLFGVGAAFTFTGNNKVKVKKWWRLRVVQI